MDITSFISGSLGGFTGLIASYPFDTLKVRIQNQHYDSNKYKGSVNFMLKTLFNERIHSLYRGMSSPLIGSMFINSILFGVESNVRKNLDFEKFPTNTKRYKTYALSGAIAGLVQGVLITPIEMIKIKMQLTDSKYKSSWQCAKYLAYQGGPKLLSRGQLLTIYREVPACSIYFVSFERILNSFDVNDNKHALWHLMMAGGLAGCASWLVTYPIDVIKTRYQANENYKTIKECILKTYKFEGYYGFWRGLSYALLRAFPSNAACFATVAFLNRKLFITNDNHSICR